jgi:tetratricopeptide (TPR) repeat protein
MDIWRWVNEIQEELTESGRTRLSELVEAIPGLVVNHKHVELDAVVPEAIALAREAKSPWLEVFIRHWNLQSRILHRHEVREFLPEAVRLIELTSRDEARECPQSVCVTQDLAGCYAKIDGPGYVAERLSVAKETLSRIDARWPCFTCIASEHATAQIDGGDAEGAIAYLDARRADLVTVGRARAARGLRSASIEALYRLRRFDEMLAEATRAREDASDENDRVGHALDRAAALAALGRHDEALDDLPPFDRILPTHSFHERWSQAVTALALAGKTPNDAALEKKLFALQERLGDGGVLRLTADLAERRARLAIARERLGTADHALAAMRAILPSLRAREGVTRAIEALEQDIAAARGPEPAPPGSAEMALALLGNDPETDLDLLRIARERFPDEERLAIIEHSARSALGRQREAEAGLRAHLADHPDAHGCLMTLGRSLLDQKRAADARALGLTALERGVPAEVAVGAHFLAATSFRQEGDPAKARPHLTAMLEHEPGNLEIELLLATLDREQGHVEEALARLDRLIALHPKPGNHDWDRMVAATLLGRWDLVRDSARRVGMKIEGEGPIDEEWGICRLEMLDPDGRTSVHHAVRTGPVTARVVEIARPRTAQHFRDEVIFEAAPRNAPPKPGEEEGHTFLYPVLHVRKLGGYQAFLIDGVHPGAEALDALRGELGDLGCTLSVRSDEAYRVIPPDATEALIGLFGYLAVPEDRALHEVHALLGKRATELAHPLVWPGLVQALELEDEMIRQAAIIERYGL